MTDIKIQCLWYSIISFPEWGLATCLCYICGFQLLLILWFDQCPELIYYGPSHCQIQMLLWLINICLWGKCFFLSYVVDFNLDLIEKHVEDMVWPWWCVGQYDLVILSCLVSIVYSNCIVQDSLYYDMVIGSKWNCVLGSCTPSQSIRLFFFGMWAVHLLSVIMCFFSLIPL